MTTRTKLTLGLFLAVFLFFGSFYGYKIYKDRGAASLKKGGAQIDLAKFEAKNPQEPPKFVDDEIIVKYKQDTPSPKPAVEKALGEVAKVKQVQKVFPSTLKNDKTGLKNTHLIKLEKTDKEKEREKVSPMSDQDKYQRILALASQIKAQDPTVEYTEPNYIYQVQALPKQAEPQLGEDKKVYMNDPYLHSKGAWGQNYDDLWGLKAIHAEEAWSYSQGEGVTVAVVDTGVDYNHEDIKDNIWINPGEVGDTGKQDIPSSDNDIISFWIHINNIENISNLSFDLYTSRNDRFGNFWSHDDRNKFQNGWNLVQIPKSKFNRWGNPDWKQITSISFFGNPITDTYLELTFDDLKLIKADDQNTFWQIANFEHNEDWTNSADDTEHYKEGNQGKKTIWWHGDMGKVSGIQKEDVWDLSTFNFSRKENNRVDDDTNGYVDDWRGFDFIGSNSYNGSQRRSDAMDQYGHGTHVAGTIAAVGNNNKGIVGVASKSKVMNLKAFDSGGYGSTEAISEAIVYAANMGARVINMSFGGPVKSLIMKEAIIYADSNNLFSVAAAGNYADNTVGFYPASDELTYTVSSVDQTGKISDFSNFGFEINSSAPGGGSYNSQDWRETYVNILSLKASQSKYDQKYNVGSNYLRLRGTSMATPHVVGVAALVLSKHLEWTPAQVKTVLQSSADDLGDPGWDIYHGYGRINALKAVKVSTPTNVKVEFDKPNDYPPINAVMKGNFKITGTAAGSDFQSYKLEYGLFRSYDHGFPRDWRKIVDSSNPVENATLGILDTTAVQEGPIALRLTVQSNKGNYSEFLYQVAVVANSTKEGWPVAFGTYQAYWSNTIMSDIDGDNYQELIVASQDNKIYIIRHDGSYQPGWPQAVDTLLSDSVAASDINNDGKVEIIASSRNNLYVWKSDGSILEGWPKPFPFRGWSTNITVDDFNGDGYKEIVTLNWGVDVWKYNGEIIEDNFGGYRSWQGKETPIGYINVVDLDKDGKKELVILTSEFDYNNLNSLVRIHVQNLTGELAGWPVTLGRTKPGTGSPYQLDVKTVKFSNSEDYHLLTHFDDKIHIFNKQGQYRIGWPQVTGGCYWGPCSSPITVGDIDGDDNLEIFTGTYDMTGGRIFAWHDDGSKVSGWPVERDDGHFETAILVGDFNHETGHEIIGLFPTRNAYGWSDGIYMIKNSSEDVTGWPKYMFAGTSIWVRQTNSPVVTDMDNDGKIEVIAVSSAGLAYAWDTDMPYDPAKIDWPMFRHDPANTGRYEPPS